MYSLYRAWLMRDAVAAATLATPPDIVVNVGGSGVHGPGGSAGRQQPQHQFAAHRAVLASHSGYLKALLGSTTGSENSLAISVPNVSPEAFAPLLTFMYTGYLDVTHDNIYGVLLATHLLHMPRALDLCRAFLVQNQQQPPSLSPRPSPLPTLVKPIPSRKMLPMLLGLPPPPPGPYWPPPGYHTLPPPPPLMLPTADNSPFRSVLPASLPLHHHTPDPEPTTTVLPSLPRRPKSPLAVPSTSSSRKSVLVRAQQTPSPPSSVSPCLSGTSFSSDDRHVISTSPSPTRPSKKSQQHHHHNNKPSSSSSGSSRKPPPPPCNNNSEDTSTTTNSGSKVIIDVACCDGPVRFHRVLNDNYGLALDDIIVNEPVAAPKEDGAAPEGVEDRSRSMDPEEDEPSPAVAAAIDCDTKTDSNAANAGSDCSAASSDKVSSSGETVYTCLYCNHTFKSHYCYQKHARRHINPVTLDLTRLADRLAGAKGACKLLPAVDKDGGGSKGPGGGGGVRREVRLLDMNVQYYPCKTCGSKFPSYYFVHKHRKMCHANEETDSVVSSEESHSQSQTATV